MNVIVGQSGGPTAAINASLAGVYETAANNNCCVYGMRYGISGLLKEDIICLNDILNTKMDIELLRRTPSSMLGSCRHKLTATPDEEYERIFCILHKRNIDCFFYIGGNDSMDTIQKLAKYGREIGSSIKFVGVPKTIDNDLAVTDHSPGYASAAKYIATSIKELVRDSLVYDTKSVTVVEIMGRNTGWLTAAASLAKGADCEGADLIYLPEIPFDIDACVEDVRRLQTSKKSLVIAISEGVRFADGRYICEGSDSPLATDVFGHKALAGAGRFLAGMLSEKLGIKSRAVELSTLQRCSSHILSLADITESYLVGKTAVEAAISGKSGVIAVLNRVSDNPYLCDTSLCMAEEIANVEKLVPRNWINESGNSICDEFIKYARPLIEHELPPIMVNGFPAHFLLK